MYNENDYNEVMRDQAALAVAFVTRSLDIEHLLKFESPEHFVEHFLQEFEAKQMDLILGLEQLAGTSLMVNATIMNKSVEEVIAVFGQTNLEI